MIGIPSYETIAEVHIKLNSNAASVHSELGNGTLGLLALTVTLAVYNPLTMVTLNAPLNPGQTCKVTPGSTGPQITALNAAHKIHI